MKKLISVRIDAETLAGVGQLEKPDPERGRSNMNLVEMLKLSVTEFNAYKKNNPDLKIDLRGADLRGADLRGANLSGASLREADLSGANLMRCILCDAFFNSTKITYRGQTATITISLKEGAI